jgi:hypothetical protein
MGFFHSTTKGFEFSFVEVGRCKVVCFNGGSIVPFLFSLVHFRGYIAEISVLIIISLIRRWRREEVSGRWRVLEILLRDGNGSIQRVERLIDLA